MDELRNNDIDESLMEDRYEELSQREIEFLENNSSIVDRRSWNKRSSNVRKLSKEIQDLIEETWDIIELIPTLNEADKVAHLKQIDQKNALIETLEVRITHQLNVMNKLCIHPPDMCVKYDDTIILCTFCQKKLSLRGVVDG